MNRYWLLFGIAILGSVISLVVLRAVYRDVRVGSFNELAIGMSKNEVLSTIFNTIGASAISMQPRQRFVVQDSNIEQVTSLLTAEKIILRDTSGFVLEFEVRNGTVGGLRVSDVRNISISIFEGQPISTALEKLREYIRNNPESIAFEAMSGFGPDGNITEVLRSDLNSPAGAIAAEWLLKTDTWSFRIPNSHKKLTIYFKNDVLSRIVYWNTFGELP